MTSLSKVSGLILILETEYLFTGVNSLLSQAMYSLCMSLTLLLRDTGCFSGTFHHLMVDLQAFSFSKKLLTFSTICLLCDVNLTPLPGFLATLCSTWELFPLSPCLFLGAIPTFMYSQFVCEGYLSTYCDL